MQSKRMRSSITGHLIISSREQKMSESLKNHTNSQMCFVSRIRQVVPAKPKQPTILNVSRLNCRGWWFIMGLPVKRSIISLLSWATAWRHGIVARPSRHWLMVLGLLSTFNLQPSTVLAQGTAFTYQGRLNDGGNPANGNYDLRFTIYDSTNIPGVVIAGPLTNSATAVSNGLFTANLDYGPAFSPARPAGWTLACGPTAARTDSSCSVRARC